MKNINELRKETIKKLEEVKNNLENRDNESNYCDMINTMIDYDNEAQDELYLYDTCRELIEFVDEEILEGIIENELKNGIERLRYFINDTYDDTIYKINAYGNLENVSDDDFKYCIDEIIERLQDTIESEVE